MVKAICWTLSKSPYTVSSDPKKSFTTFVITAGLVWESLVISSSPLSFIKSDILLDIPTKLEYDLVSWSSILLNSVVSAISVAFSNLVFSSFLSSSDKSLYLTKSPVLMS